MAKADYKLIYMLSKHQTTFWLHDKFHLSNHASAEYIIVCYNGGFHSGESLEGVIGAEETRRDEK